MKVAVVTFGPFGGRQTNGSTTAGAALAEMLGAGAKQIVLPTRWASLVGIQGRLSGYDAIIGLGEGFGHFVSVERMAVRQAAGKGIDRQPPPADLFPADGPEVLVSGITWDPGWNGSDIKHRLRLPSGSLGIAANGFDGTFLCNGLHYLLLYHFNRPLRGKVGFIHLPPQKEWMERTGETAEQYGRAFASAIAFVLRRNNWQLPEATSASSLS